MYRDYITNKTIVHDNCITQFIIYAHEIFEDIEIPNGIAGLIIHCEKNNLVELLEKIEVISKKTSNANINIMFRENEKDISANHFISMYDTFLNRLKSVILSEWKRGNYININILTSELFANTNRYCGAGESSLFLSPEGDFYICSAFYNQNQGGYIGSLDKSINNKYYHACNMDKAPLCQKCCIRHCSRCVYKNKTKTGEYSIPSEEQCIISYLEYKYSRELMKTIIDEGIALPFDINKKIPVINSPDPVTEIRGTHYLSHHLNLLVKPMEK